MALQENDLKVLDLAALAGICFTLLAAFFFQLAWGELPCAFCNLIRVALMIFGGGLLLNLWQGFNAWNYVLSAVGGLIGSLISLLFLFVKAPPDSVPTGSAVFGLHMYSWTFLISTAAGLYCVFMLAFYAMKQAPQASEILPSGAILKSKAKPVIAGLFIFLVGANVVSAFLQNGFDHFRAGGQQHYRMLYDGDIMKP